MCSSDLFDPEGFNAGAERAIFWTRQQLETGENSERRWEFLGELPRIRREPGLLFVHGSARNPLNEYVFPEDIYNQRKMERIFGLVERWCFQGHTHIPGIFTEDLNFLSPEEVNFEYRLTNQKHLVNVGSVGQPRNGVPDSSYVILDGDKLTYRRVKSTSIRRSRKSTTSRNSTTSSATVCVTVARSVGEPGIRRGVRPRTILFFG